MAGWMDKAKDYIKGNPEQAGSAIDKVEKLIDQRTGGKHADKVDKGGDFVREKLGIPGDGKAGTIPAGQGSTGQGPTEQSGRRCPGTVSRWGAAGALPRPPTRSTTGRP